MAVCGAGARGVLCKVVYRQHDRGYRKSNRASCGMRPALRPTAEWPTVLRRYLAASFILHLAWEVIQLPLYTIWSEPYAKQAFAILHCTIGDIMIAGLSLLAALAFIDRSTWPRSDVQTIWLLILGIGVGYTFYSEWLNVNVRRSWAYSPLMPTVPFIDTGLAPLLQWIVVPTAVQR